MSGSTGSPLLRVDGLTVGFGPVNAPIKIVTDVDLHINRGEALGLVGESGSGKSTIASAVLDLMTPGLRVLGGKVLYEGRDLRGLDPMARRAMLGSHIGAVFQDPFTSLNPSKRIGDQISEPLRVHKGISPARALAMTHDLLADVGIADPKTTAQAYQHQLSGGMRQRALIAMALACDPPLLVLDEPTTALDAEVETQFLLLLQRLRRERDLSLLFISHNLAVVRRVCDRVAVLYAGEVIETGPTESVLFRPSHPYTRALLGSVPRLGAGLKERLRPIKGNLPPLGQSKDACRFAPRCSYAVAKCLTKQVLQPLDDCLVRCWRAPELQTTIDAAEPETRLLRKPFAADDTVVLSADKISKSYPVGSLWSGFRVEGGRIRYEAKRFHAVKQMTLNIRRGEILGLVGQSGSGKSSLGRLLLRLDELTSGEVVFKGEQITGRPPKTLLDFRRRAQMVFQNPDSSLNPRISVGDILARPLQLFGLTTGAETRREVERLLELVRLPASYTSRFAHELSGGEKQRIGIARALASRPELVICDEPVSALDVSVQAAIVNLIEDLRDELGLSVLFISHDIAIVGHLCDRIAVMYRGELCEIGPSEQILNAPTHAYTRGLLAAVQHLGAPGDGNLADSPSLVSVTS